MGERERILATPSPNTLESLHHDFAELGIAPGDTVLVHASLSSLGWVCGGPQAVILALLAAIRSPEKQGTLVMPAHSGDWSDPAEWRHPPVPPEWIPVIREQMPAYDPALTPTRGMGAIPELFRTFPGTHRSTHPQLSFSANGPLADEILSDHPLTPALGFDSPLGRLYGCGAKVLLLGVGYDVCTSFHLAETRLPGMPAVRMGTAVTEHDIRTWKWFEDYDYDSDDFACLGAAFETGHPVRTGQVGMAQCRLFNLKTCVDFACEWLPAHRRDGRPMTPPVPEASMTPQDPAASNGDMQAPEAVKA